MGSRNHSLVIGVLGMGLAIAMFFDGAFGGSPAPVPVIANVPKDQAPAKAEQERAQTASERDQKERLKSYEEQYKDHLEKERKKEEQKLAKKINMDAYVGDGSPTSRRLYLLHQAYKASREATPVIVPKKKRTKNRINDADSDSDESECVDLKELATLLADDASTDGDSEHGTEKENTQDDVADQEDEEEPTPPPKKIKVPPPPPQVLMNPEGLGQHHHMGAHTASAY